MFTMPSVPRRYGDLPLMYASTCLANTSSRTRFRFSPCLPKMLLRAVALVLPLAWMVAMSPPHVMIGTCTGPAATAPTGDFTTCVSGGDWMYGTAACARPASTHAKAPSVAATLALFMFLPGTSLQDGHIVGLLARAGAEMAPVVVEGLVLGRVPARDAEDGHGRQGLRRGEVGTTGEEFGDEGIGIAGRHDDGLCNHADIRVHGLLVAG